MDVHFGPAVPEDQRDDIESSIRAMAARSTEERDKARAAEARHQKLANAINAPLAKLVKQDSSAVSEFEDLLAQQKFEFDSASILHPQEPIEVEEASLVVRTLGVKLETPPYPFDWKWHQLNGSAPYDTFLNRSRGAVGIEARCGPLVPGSGGKFVNAHAGFGVFVRPTVSGILTCDSLRLMTWGYFVGALGIGSNATVEGGVEHTIMEDGVFRAGGSHKLFRKRVSVDEVSSGHSQGVIADSPMPVSFPVLAGHGYTFNVGAWVYADNTAGVGTSGAVAVIGGGFPSMTVNTP
ncbi:hypothetical protein ABZ471_47075 [Streptomyces sp. NPDC005728]|uniref:hypothetical protein n=1 Tax=Streptomyces sp. NPDC005728 TaxID=3157054 RepID=UPI0033F0034C